MYTMLDAIESATFTLQQQVDKMRYVQPDELGIDRRAAYRVWVDKTCVVIERGDLRSFNYYGGGEYVDEEHVYQVGDYVIYMNDDSRVQGWIDYMFNEELEDCEEIEE